MVHFEGIMLRKRGLFCGAQVGRGVFSTLEFRLRAETLQETELHQRSDSKAMQQAIAIARSAHIPTTLIMTRRAKRGFGVTQSLRGGEHMGGPPMGTQSKARAEHKMTQKDHL